MPKNHDAQNKFTIWKKICNNWKQFSWFKISKKFINYFIKNFLAACIQIKKIESLYIWQKKIANKKEF